MYSPPSHGEGSLVRIEMWMVVWVTQSISRAVDLSALRSSELVMELGGAGRLEAGGEKC